MGTLDRWLAARVDLAPAVLRVGLGTVILLEGLHKVVAPGVWAAYAAPWTIAVWPAPMRPTMVASGAVQVAFGLALLADRHTTAVATVLALAIGVVVINLTTFGLSTGAYVDAAIRDLGLVVLAAGVAVQSAGDGG